MNANWIEVNDARTSEKLWVNAALVTAIDVTQGYTRIRFDKDNALTVTQKPLQVLAAIGVK
jgi:hypothetical protein